MSMPIQELELSAKQERAEKTVRRNTAHVQAGKEARSRHDRFKRLFDIAGAIVGLILVSPLLLAAALAVKLDDPRAPVLFRQTRIGKDGRAFTMYKIRSMVTDAERMIDTMIAQNDVSGAMFKMKDDPRVTKVGKWIRRTSIDELPQLWNVLRGEMSLVGPRPPLPREVAQYREHDWQRLSVLPGCTGLWQISGRNSVGFKEMVELDLAYIRKRSLWLDVVILVLTVKVLLGSRNAW